MSRQQLANLGLGVGTVFFPEVRPFGDVLGSGLGLLFSSSGVTPRRNRTVSVCGTRSAQVRPDRDGRVFLGVGTAVGRRAARSVVASTHPDPADRKATILALVREQAASSPESRPELRVGQLDYLEKIDG